MSILENYRILNFKESLKKIRKERNYTQEQLAEKLNFQRTTIANWERIEENSTVPSLADFLRICNLFDVDPNYLLGGTTIESNNNEQISEAIGLSTSNIRKLKENDDTSKFINFLLHSDEAQDAIKRMKDIYYYKIVSTALGNTLNPHIFKAVEKASDKFFSEESPIDMSIDIFITYLKKEIKWNPNKCSIDTFIEDAFMEKCVSQNLFEKLNNLDEQEKYDMLIQEIADLSYDDMIKHSMIEISRSKISHSIDAIISNFIDTDIKSRLQRLKSN